jgi:antitoxin component of RelBE/YafQ-DinJ toxin-antitoxin module
MKKNDKAITFLINQKQLDELDAILEDVQVSRSQAFRIAFEYYAAHPDEVYANSRSKSPRDKIITIYVSDDMHRDLTQTSKDIGISMSQGIRLAADYFTNNWVGVYNEVNKIRAEVPQ